MIVEYEYDISNIPDTVSGYREDMLRINELKEKSRLSAYDSDSSGSDHSMTSFCAKRCIKEQMSLRMRQQCTVCTTKESEHSFTNITLLDKANKIFDSKKRIFNALQLNTTRKIARKTDGLIELYPGWFTTTRSFDSVEEIKCTFEFFHNMFSDKKLQEKLEQFIAKHPLPHTSCSPIIQNLRGKHFISAVLLYYARENNCDLDSSFLSDLREDLPELIRETL